MGEDIVMENKIKHPEYGTGIIKHVIKKEEGYWVTVDFEDVGEKQLLSLINPLEEKFVQ